MLRATPRFPDDDSIRIDPGFRRPSRSAASTISAAAFSLIEPAKLKPSHFRNSEYPKIDRRSTYRSTSLKSSGLRITGMKDPSSQAKVWVCVGVAGRIGDRKWAGSPHTDTSRSPAAEVPENAAHR